MPPDDAILAPLECWFAQSGWTPFAFQRETWRAYLAGRSGLVHAPTGTGKTYAVWLGPLAEWLSQHSRTEIDGSSRSGDASNAGRRAATPARNEKDGYASPLRVLWITPLRALANDTAENLRAALTALDIPWTVESRTGDTSQAVRRRQRKSLPEALITTPESLSVLLSYPGASNHFRNLRCAIVDEWHELLSTKRGVQTELGLARLRSVSPMLRIWGLSATLGNLEQAMAALLGSTLASPSVSGQGGVLIRGEQPKTTIVDTLRPDSVERFPWAGHLGLRLLPEVIRAIESARTTLLFTNVRSQAEIWFQQILKARPDLIGSIALHHGSLDRDIRTQVEDLLRTGRIRCVVCTSSLDLGVDFTPVDQVIQLGSPKGIARMMQRAGRSGHQPGAPSRILGVPTNALELIEFAAARDAAGALGADRRRSAKKTTAKAAKAAGPPLAPQVESRQPLDRPLDVLVQHLVTLAAGDGFDSEAMRDEIRSTYAFNNLTDHEWQWAMDFITQGGPALTAYPHFKKVSHVDGRFVVIDKQIERLHRMSIGTITSDTAVKVAFQSGASLGMIEESFISRLKPGDRFVFAGRVLELIMVRNLVATVRRARQKTGIVPRWMGGRSPLSTLLSQAVRNKLNEARQGIYNSPEMRLVKPLLQLQAAWSIIPRPNELLIEQCETRDGHHVFVFPFEGRLVHEGLSSLIAHRIALQKPRSLHVTANDYGFELLSREPIALDEDEWRQVFSTEELVHDLLDCLNTTALARRQFRDIARVAGLIFPGFPGAGKTVRQLQASSELFFEVFTQYDPGNLLLDQARREVLDRELEVVRLRETLQRIRSSRIVIVHTEQLTPLSFPLWAESIRTQHISTESWFDRVQRMMVELEHEAGQPRNSTRAKTRRARARSQ